MTFKHDNKSCSACPKDHFQVFKVFNNIQTLKFLVASACLTFGHFCWKRQLYELFLLQIGDLTHCRHAEQLLFSCLCSKVTLYRWKCQWFLLDHLILITLSSKLTGEGDEEEEVKKALTFSPISSDFWGRGWHGIVDTEIICMPCQFVTCCLAKYSLRGGPVC